MDLFNWNEYYNSEKPAIDLLIQLGYTYKKAEEITNLSKYSERTTLRQVILTKTLIKKIKEFNPWITDSNIKKIIRELTIFLSSSEIETNEQIWRYLTKKGELFVEQDLGDGRGRRKPWVKLIDWDNPDNNDFLVTNQFKVNAPKGNRIPDIVCFVNGLPLVVIECKSPTLTNPLTQAIKQVVEYQKIIPKLFNCNQLIIVTCGQSARYGVIGNSFEHFKEWKEPYPINFEELEKIIAKTGRKNPNPNPQDVIIYGLLEKNNLLDIIRNFIIFERYQGKIVKKVARYQQFRAVNKTIKRVLTAKKPDLRGGTIWHTQGSGKSLTMLFTAIKLRREPQLNNPLLVFVTDRIDLVEQLNGTFDNCGFPNPIIPNNAEELKSLIKTGQGVTIFTTIQKFRTKDADRKTGLSKSGEKYPEINTDENIFVLVDEAHRSQNKIFGMNMRIAMPNACYIAYTGTPLARNEKNELISVGKGKTVRKFGSFIDVYDIRQSVADGSTVKILYENRLPELSLEGETIDTIFERVFADKSEKEREALKKKYATKEAILAASERIKKVALDIVTHYETHIAPNNFKAQIVVANRELAVIYKKYLDMFNGPESVVIISANTDYDEKLKKHGVPYITNKSEQKNYIERFKDPEDPLKFLIVCDMLITGFDAPIEQVMYLDKSLREHNLLQAIARVNRTYENKTYGLIVDYYGISNNLEDALEIFDKPDVEGYLQPIESELPRLEQFHRKVMSYFNNIDKTDLEACISILEPEAVRNSFHHDCKLFVQSLDLVLPDPRAQPYVSDLKWLGKLIRAARNRFRDEQLEIAGYGGKVKEIIDEHIRTLKIIQLVEPVPILSDKFNEALNALKSEKAQASEMEHAIRHEITTKAEEDPIFYRSLKERLEEIIRQYNEERISLAEKIKRLKALIIDIKEKPSIARKLGLNTAELAFFNLHKEDLQNAGIEDEREIVKFTYEILESIEPFVTIVDWHLKADILRQIRKACKQKFYELKDEFPLEKTRYHPLSQQIVELAKVHFSMG